jgi:hypothetical protein
MQSIISMMSVNNNLDIAPLDDLEDIADLESVGDLSEHVLDFTQQLEQLTSSLNSSELTTPMSCKMITSVSSSYCLLIFLYHSSTVIHR